MIREDRRLSVAFRYGSNESVGKKGGKREEEGREGAARYGRNELE